MRFSMPLPGKQEALEELCRLALQEGANRRELCRRFGVQPRILYKWLERYRLLYIDAVGPVGITPAQVARLWCHDLVSITIVPAAIFSQTPGPGAGNPLASGPPWT